MIVYISGGITGVVDYKERFAAAEKRLKEKGYIVLNPAALPEGLTHEAYMQICLPMVRVADAIYLLADWQKSPGATAEFFAARKDKKIIWYERVGLPGVRCQALWAGKDGLYITNLQNETIRAEYDQRRRELSKRHDEALTDRERVQFDRDMVAKYGLEYPPPGWVEWRLKIWEFAPPG